MSESDGLVHSLPLLSCVHSLPQNCSGTDTDLDNIPDSCDSCPYIFNPAQNVEVCRREEEVCPAELAAGVLWSSTPAGTVNSKPCPPPLAGRWGGGRESQGKCGG